jgi:L-threonylcarbamoyladenylate synthase
MVAIISLERAAELLKQGSVVAFPTETVYGLGATLFNEKAIQQIFHAKKRPSDNPLIVHIGTREQLPRVVREVCAAAHALIEAFFPGPLTLILPKHPSVSPLVTAGLDTVAIRMPAHPLAQKLIECVGEPLVAPSANLSGRPSATRPEHVIEDFKGVIAGLLDGGECHLGIESTILLVSPTPVILRPGVIRREEIESVLHRTVAYASKEEMEIPLSPGLKYRHYAPSASVKLLASKKELALFLSRAPSVNRIILSEVHPKELYSLLRSADRQGYEEILIVCDERMRTDPALMNRLIKAAEESFLNPEL